MPARLLLVLRWVALVVMALAIAMIVVRRKFPSPSDRKQSLIDSLSEMLLRWRDAREDGRERSANLAALRRKKTVVVDPEEKSAKVLAWRLQKLGCGVHRARTGAQGLARIREIDPDFLVTDGLLPDMTAAEFFQRLPKQDVPIVFVGVVPGQWDDLRSLGRGVMCFSKPFDPDEVASFVGMMIRRESSEKPPRVA